MSIATAIESAQGKVAAAYTACNNKGATMPASANQNLSNLATTIGTIPTGGGAPNLTTLAVTPSTSAQQLTPTAPVDGWDEVNVSPVTASIDNNISAGNIKKDVTILGVTGTYEGSGGGGGGSATYKVYWFDYDGTVLKEDTVAEGGSSTAPTTMPTHQYLTFQEWVHGNTITNVTQDYFNIARYSSTYDYVVRKVNIGADQSYRLRIGNQKTNNDPVVVDWGDGTTETFTSSTSFIAEHVYATAFSGYVLVYSTTGKNITTLRLNTSVGEYGVEEYYFGAKGVISDYAYLGCSNKAIKAVVLPNSLTQLRRALFCHFSCTVLAVPSTVTSFEGNLLANIRPRPNNLIAINVPSNTTSFGDDELADITSLKFITKDLYLTSMGRRPFGNTSIGGELTFKSSVTTMGNSAFYLAIKIRKISIQTGTFTSLGVYTGGCFQDCESLEEIVLPSSLPISTLGNSTFANSTRLKTITNFPKNATTLGNLVFSNCRSLETPIEFTNVTSMGTGVFTNCYKIPSVKIGGTFTTLNPNSNGFFAGCRALTSVQLPNTITTFGNSTFGDCWSLMSITLPTSLTTMGNTVFSGCTKLTSITLPETAMTIGQGFAQNCSQLKSIYIGASTTFSSNSNFCANTFSLMEIDCAQGWRPTVDITFNASLYLYPDMLETFFTHLGDNTGYTARKITIGTTNLNRLSAAQKAIATGKNYTLA